MITPKPGQLLEFDLAKIAKRPEMRERLATLRIEPVGSTPEQLRATMQFELARWATPAQSLGLRQD
jgi:tripartite-type tricarboxylate transporter receptor subunit TctC